MKKLLLIAPAFFGYYKDMIQEAESLGYSVDFVYDAPSNSNVSKALGRINKRLISRTANKYYEEKVLPLVKKESYDSILLVAGMTCAFTSKMFSQMKYLQKRAGFIMYQWDSEKNLPYTTEIHPYFERIYSFDRNDCERDERYRFCPLFYTENYENVVS